MTQQWMLVCAAALAACGGGTSASSAGPAQGPEQAVSSFLKAVTDSNIAAMSTYWGTAHGPAASTGQPPDYEKRMVVAQLYLRGASFKVVRDDPVQGDPDHRVVVVDLDRQQCVRTVPITTVKTSNGSWLVTAFDLNLAGTPQRPCDKDSAKP